MHIGERKKAIQKLNFKKRLRAIKGCKAEQSMINKYDQENHNNNMMFLSLGLTITNVEFDHGTKYIIIEGERTKAKYQKTV